MIVPILFLINVSLLVINVILFCFLAGLIKVTNGIYKEVKFDNKKENQSFETWWHSVGPYDAHSTEGWCKLGHEAGKKNGSARK